MRQGLVVASAQRGLPRVALQRFAQDGFNASIATAQYHQLATPGDQFRQHGRQQVQTLLFAQARHRCKQQRVGTVLQSQPALQGTFDARLAAHALDIKAGVEQWVGGRVPDLVVNAVQDSADMVAACAQHAVQAAALFWRHDLLRVARADSGDGVGKLQAGLHEGKLPVKLCAVDGERGLGYAEFCAKAGAKQALVSQVVDGEHAGRDWSGAGQQLQVQRGQTGMPVVRMYHVGLPVWVSALPECRSGPTQQSKARSVVTPVLASRILVRPTLALVQRRGMEQVNRQTAFDHMAGNKHR